MCVRDIDLFVIGTKKKQQNEYKTKKYIYSKDFPFFVCVLHWHLGNCMMSDTLQRAEEEKKIGICGWRKKKLLWKTKHSFKVIFIRIGFPLLFLFGREVCRFYCMWCTIVVVRPIDIVVFMYHSVVVDIFSGLLKPTHIQYCSTANGGITRKFMHYISSY